MMLPPLFRCFTWGSIVLLSACALMSRPQALTTVRLEPAPASLAWSSGIKPGRVTAATALQGTRVVVSDDALLMQYQGLRWIDSPAVMMSEYLRDLYARHATSHASDSDVASLDLWLTEFNLRLDPEDRLTIAISAAAELRCAADGPVRYLAPQSASTIPAGKQAQAIAAGFASAVHAITAALLIAAAEQTPLCIPGGDRSL